MPLLFDLSEELIKWVEENGDIGTGKSGVRYPYINWGKRFDLLVVLLTHLKKAGAEKEYFQRDKVKTDIAQACTAPKAAIGKKNWLKGMSCSYADINRARGKVFGTDYDYYQKNGKMPAKSEEKEEVSQEEKIATENDAEAEAIAKKAKPHVARDSEYVAPDTDEPPEPKHVFEEFVDSGNSKYTTVDNPDPELDVILGYKDE